MSQISQKSVKKVLKSVKNDNHLYCACCDYYASQKSHFRKHLNTKKHLKNASQTSQKASQKSVKSVNFFICEFCDKKYKSRNGLWHHKKKCMQKNLKITTDPEKEELKKENEDMKNMLKLIAPVLEAIGENGGISSQNNCNNTTNNTINNNININVYLNEHCKNALNIEDFVKKILIEDTDYQFALQNGYEKGVTNVLIKNIGDLDDTERPIHSSDKKRGKFYVKSQGEWKKENGEMVDKVITTVGNKLNTYDVDNITAEDFKDPEVMELYQKNTLKLAKKSDPKEASKERKKIKNELANTVSLKDALEKANEQITND